MVFIFTVQQRYVLTAVMFLALGVTFALRMSFSLVLTQMVYIPNANTENHTIDSNGEEICPTRYPEKPQNVSSSVCEI